MKNIDDIYDKVKKRKDQLSALFEKDKENYDLWVGAEQEFDKHKMAVNITGTEMVEKSRKVIASLRRSRLDIHVYPPDKYSNPEAPEQANQEERMYYFGFDRADERLSLIGEPILKAASSWQAVVPGRVAVRVLVYEKDGEIIWDYLPLNPSFFYWEYDRDGLAWACYETFRSPSSIKSEYGVEVKDDYGKGISVSDHWDREHNVRYVTADKTRLGKAWKHGLEEVPIIFQPVTIAPKTIDSEGMKVTSWGDSIFDPVKIPFRNLNKMRSIAATQAHMSAKRPIEVIYEDGTLPNIEEDHFEFHAGAKMAHPKSVELKLMEMMDISQGVTVMIQDLQRGIERATYTELAPDVAAHSGSALRILGQGKQDTENPFASAMNTLYTRICKMAKKQIISQGLTIPVKTVVNKAYSVFDMKPEFLDNDFYVEAEFVRQDVYDEEAALQKAQLYQSNRWGSRETIMEKHLLVQDVPTEILKMDVEDLEAAVPEFKLKKLIKSYQERGMPEEANMAMEQLAILELQKQMQLQQMMGAGQRATGQPAPQGQPQGQPTRPPAGAR